MENMNEVFNTTAKAWKMHPDQVHTVFLLVRSLGGKYGKAHRRLKGMGVIVSTRQIKYFYRKVKLHERIQISKKGKPANYRETLRKL